VIASPAAAKTAQLRVLVADDNAHMRTLLVTMLGAMGVTAVREARDGAEAMDAVRYWRPNLAVVDLHMAPVDGLAFTRLIRQAEDSPDPFLPIILLTAHSEKELVLEARDAGVHDFLVKPVSAKALAERMNAVIARDLPFVRSVTYAGPDRRRLNKALAGTPRRRWSDIG
jgi:two-component system, chemotaxis family, chemotaxis protein CheY